MGYAFELPSWEMASMPEGYRLDAAGRKVPIDDEEQAKAERQRAALERVAENERAKED